MDRFGGWRRCPVVGGRQAQGWQRRHRRRRSHLSPRWLVDPAEVDFTAIRAQGAGGQNVNKVSSAAHLRFDILASSLPEEAKVRLLNWPDQRISRQGVVVIKAQTQRSLAANQTAALARLQLLVDQAVTPLAARKPTKPTKASKRRRLQNKTQRGATKASRRLNVTNDS